MQRTTTKNESEPKKNGELGKADDPSKVKKMDIGLDTSARKAVTTTLNRVLANEAVLQTKTRKAHWDIVGPQFYSLHKLWDDQYERLNARIDELAERIRQLGGFPVATMAGWLEHATLVESPGNVMSPTEAVAKLLTDHELVIRTLRTFIDKSDEASDVGTADLLTRLIQDHEQMAWMLRAFIEGEAVHHKVDGRASIPDFA